MRSHEDEVTVGDVVIDYLSSLGLTAMAGWQAGAGRWFTAAALFALGCAGIVSGMAMTDRLARIRAWNRVQREAQHRCEQYFERE